MPERLLVLIILALSRVIGPYLICNIDAVYKVIIYVDKRRD